MVLIIGILAAIALPQYEAAVLRSRMAELVTGVRSIRDAEERYFMATGEYTSDWNNLDISVGQATNVEEERVSSNGNIFRLYAGEEYDGGFVAGSIPQKVAVTMYFASAAKLRGHVARCYAIADDKAANQACLSAGGNLKASNEECNLGQGQKKCNVYVLW